MVDASSSPAPLLFTSLEGVLDSILPGITFRFPVATVVLVGIAAALLGVLAAILPARRAARLNVIEAINYE